MALIETWFVTNNYSIPLTLSDIATPYTVNVGETVDLLTVGNNTQESIGASAILRNYNRNLVSGTGLPWLSSDYLHTHDEFSLTTHTHTGLNILTGGPTSDADSLHTHDGLTTVLEVNALIDNALVEGIDLSDYVRKDGSINQISDITSTGVVVEDAVAKAHDEEHTLLEHLDDDPVTVANLIKLMDGSNADCCHTHSGLTGNIIHNDLSGLNDGDYIHLTALEKVDFVTLTDGSNADLLHVHSGSGGVHNSLIGLQGGDGVDEYYHLTEEKNDLVSRFGEDSSGLTFDGVSISSGASVHNSLLGLQGGAVNEYYHLTSDQVDDVDVIPLLLPSEPSNFPSEAMTVTSSGSSPRVCSGAIPDNTAGGSLGSPGDAVTRRTSSTVSTNTIQDSGPGNTGTITAYVNNSADGAITFTTGDDSATNGALIISDNVDYPSETPGFWMSFDAQMSKTGMSTGWNRFKIIHDGAGTTGDIYFIYDNLNTAPTVSGATVTENSPVNTSYSSGILHYGAGTILNVNTISMTNLSGYTYYGGSDVITIDDNGSGMVGGNETKTFVDLGYVTPVAINITVSTLFSNNQTVDLDGTTIHVVDNIKYRGRNVVNSGSYVVVSTPDILYIQGTQESHGGSFVDEDNVYVDDSELGTSPVSTNAQRIETATGDTPAETFIATTTDWVANAALDTWDAAIVGGVLSHDVTDYSTGYLPAGGSDLSGQDASQYVAFWFRRTPVSKFDIQLTAPSGVAGCWVELAGVSETYATTNVWWDMTIAYGGAGTPGTQGGANGSNGVALSGTIPTGTAISNQRYTCTFGDQSSSTATNNNIIVRFKLTSGQSITSLSFRGASN